MKRGKRKKKVEEDWELSETIALIHVAALDSVVLISLAFAHGRGWKREGTVRRRWLRKKRSRGSSYACLKS